MNNKSPKSLQLDDDSDDEDDEFAGLGDDSEDDDGDEPEQTPPNFASPSESEEEGASDSESGAFCTLVPIRPRWRGERRSLRTFAVVFLRPSPAFNTRPRRLSTPSDAFQLHPDIALYGTTLRPRRRGRGRTRSWRR